MYRKRKITIKLRLILPNRQDLDSDDSDRQVTHSRHFKFLTTKLTFVVASILIAIPLATNAGVFSAVVDIFVDSEDSNPVEIDTTLNSQTIALLSAAPNSDPDLSRGGGDTTIVDGSALLADAGPLGTIADVDDTNTSDQISVYVVREGDTLSQIAEIFNVSVNTIRWANEITRGKSIHEGDVLVILPVSGVSHEVAKGETLASIAKEFGGDLEEIALFNGVDSAIALAVGTELIIPNGEIEAPAGTASRTSSGPSYSGYYTRPISGGHRSQGIHGYNGVDLATYAGAPIYAAAGGRVIISRAGGWNGGYGSYIVIKHDNGTQTLYAHNSQNVVSVGQPVVSGQVIGYVGSTGRSTGAHVHFEIRGARNPF